jgi:para-nitrobenzyl esterase
MKLTMNALLILLLGAAGFVPGPSVQQDGNRVSTANGVVQGTTLASGILVFKGIPYAAPPVRDLRWRAPQPPANWQGVRLADRFAAQCMQTRVFGDMMFRNAGISEDCLYLNVWTPEARATAKRPVLVYFFGGGFIAGDGSEPRYDGESLARKGIVVVTISYRLGIFGFFAHPELTVESPHHAAGNYALLDQTEALRWVQRNIAAFGGDPSQVAIAGESAGSFAVSAQVASPLAKGLFARAIGESGSALGTFAPIPLAEAEQQGTAFAKRVGAASLADLRAMPAMQLLEAAARPGAPRFALVVDGYFFPKPPSEIYAAGEQAHVPLLVGWNSEEMSGRVLLGPNDATPESFKAAVERLYGEHASEVLQAYPASTNEEAAASATALASDRFIAYSTWKWAEMQRLTGHAPVYRYFYAHPRPPMRPEMGNATAGLAGGVTRGGNDQPPPPPPAGAVHSAEIEYALGNLATNPVYAWTDDDYTVSRLMEDYFANFIKTGDPNGPGLPQWPAMGSAENGPVTFMRIDVTPQAQTSTVRDRYLLLDRLSK